MAVEYDTEIDTSKLTKSTFKVSGRTVTKVYANRAAALADSGGDGRYVIVEMSPDDTTAALWVTQQGSGSASGSPTQSQSQSQSQSSTASPSASSSASGDSGDAPGGGGPGVGDSTPGGTIKAAKATLVQKAHVTTTSGVSYPASSTELTTTAVKNLIVDDFEHLMHDASVVNVATVGPLVQGLGAVCWASPEDQAKHEAFVLAPEYGSVVVDDEYKPSPLFDATADLVLAVTKKYSVDPKRRYATGQSMGAMMSLGLNIKYPDLFAASFRFGCQRSYGDLAPRVHHPRHP